jgi:hypothetical protein
MTRNIVIRAATLCLVACAGDLMEGGEAQALEQQQGQTLYGINLQGESLRDMSMLGFSVNGATLSGTALTNVRVERGELVAQRGSTTLRGTALSHAHFRAQVRNLAAGPAVRLVEFRIGEIGEIVAEDSKYDTTHTGNTFLYPLEQLVAETGAWQPACAADQDGRRVAIPLAAIWDERGDRSVSNQLFTFSCTTGVVAKCYRWGYRPWVTGYGDLVAMHWTCTRLARADYCGIGTTHTRDDTDVNVWDNLPRPGPILKHGTFVPLPLPLPLPLPPPGMLFEAGWNTGGAVCMSRTRWVLGGLIVAQLCPNKLISPGLLGQTVCDTLSEVLDLDSNAKMFNEAKITNLVGPGLVP